MPGPDPKPESRRQRRNKRLGPKLVREAMETGVPEAPREWLKTTRTMWDEFWQSPLTRVIEIRIDLPALFRLFKLYDERHRAYRGYREERLTKGSQGQQVLNPLGKQMLRMDKEIRQLEKEFGLTPRSRARLGIEFGEARKSLDDINRALQEDPDEDPREVIDVV